MEISSQQHITAFNTGKVSHEEVRTATFCSEYIKLKELYWKCNANINFRYEPFHTFGLLVCLFHPVRPQIITLIHDIGQIYKIQVYYKAILRKATCARSAPFTAVIMGVLSSGIQHVVH